MLVFFSLITFQLLHVSYFETTRNLQKKMWIKVPCVLLLIFLVPTLVLVNATPAGFVLYSWLSGSINVFNVTFLFNVENVTNNKIPTIVLRDLSIKSMDVHSLNDSTVIDNLNQFEPFAKLVITFFTVSSALSFLLFIVALLCTYKCAWLRKCTTRNKDIEQGGQNGGGQNGGGDLAKIKPLDSFRDDDDKTSTKLDLPESLYFCLLFVLNIALLIVCIVLFVSWHYNKPSYYDSPVAIGAEGAVFCTYMYSLLCTIVSCFIFSKLAYSVTRRCLDLIQEFKKCQDNDILALMLEKDDNFTDMAQATLNMFEYWFTVHWVCYTVTSFLSIALFFDMLEMYIKSNFVKPVDTAVGFSYKELVVVGLFTLQHCFLFLYPCFKAAAVTVGREKLIKKVNAWQDGPLNREDKQFLIQYLKNKKFGFRISFFCARLRFGFNVAYISIFIGLLGVLLKLTNVF